MKKEVLLELANRWDNDVEELGKHQDAVEDSHAGSESLGRKRGQRETKKECADALRMLVSLLG